MANELTDEFHALADVAIARLTELAALMDNIQAEPGENQRERQAAFDDYANRVLDERDRMVKIKRLVEEI